MPLVLFMCMHVILVFSITFIKGTQSQENFRGSNMRSRRSSGKSTAFRGCWISCWLEAHVFYNSELFWGFLPKRPANRNFSVDSVKKRPDNRNFSVDSVKKRPANRNFSVDSVKKDQTIETSRLIPSKKTSQSELLGWFRQKRPDNRNFSVDSVQRDQPIGTSRLIPAKETSQSELFCWFRL